MDIMTYALLKNKIESVENEVRDKQAVIDAGLSPIISSEDGVVTNNFSDEAWEIVVNNDADVYANIDNVLKKCNVSYNSNDNVVTLTDNLNNTVCEITRNSIDDYSVTFGSGFTNVGISVAEKGVVNLQIDNTLTKQGMAADAKAVNDICLTKIDRTITDLNELYENGWYFLTQDKAYSNTPSDDANSGQRLVVVYSQRNPGGTAFKQMMYYNAASGFLAFRVYHTGSWKSWKQMASIENLRSALSVIDDKADVIIDNASGDMVNIYDGADNVPLERLTVDIEPIQDLHGYENPWPGGGGLNLLDPNKRTEYGTGYGQRWYESDGFLLKANQSYTFSVIYSSWIALYIVDKETKTALATSNNVLTYTPSEDITVYFQAYRNENISSVDTFQLEIGSEQTSYSPYSNICPISGWTGAKVTRTGKNLLDKATGKIASQRFVTFGVANFSDTIPDGSLILKTGTYTLSLFGVNDSDMDSIAVFDSTGTRLKVAYTKTSLTFTLPSNSAIKLTFAVKAASFTSWDNYDLQLELGSTATDYEPYTGNSYEVSWETEVGTVYGGKLDMVSGELVMDRVRIDLNNSALWKTSSSNTITYYYDLPFSVFSNRKLYDNSFSGLICSCIQVKSGATETARWSGASSYIFGIKTNTLTLEDVQQIAWNDGISICYELATSITYNLTQQQITTLLGENHIWADCGIVNVDYCVDTKTYIDSAVDGAIDEANDYTDDKFEEAIDTIEEYAVEIDDTLTQSGEAADAKVVGDKFDKINVVNTGKVEWEYGTYNPETGEKTDNNNYIRCDVSIGYVDGIKKIVCNPFVQMIVFGYDLNGDYIGSYRDFIFDKTQNLTYVTSFDISKYPEYMVKIVVRHTGRNTNTSDGQYVIFINNIDDTLTQSNEAADAKITRDIIDIVNTGKSAQWKQGIYVPETGDLVDNVSYYIRCDTLVGYVDGIRKIVCDSSLNHKMYIYAFDSNGDYVGVLDTNNTFSKLSSMDDMYACTLFNTSDYPNYRFRVVVVRADNYVYVSDGRYVTFVSIDDTLTQNNVAADAKATGDAICDLVKGNYYLPSQIVSGYLDTNGDIGEYNKRATFSEYIKITYACHVKFDEGYAGTICTYNDNKEMTSRQTYPSGGEGDIPANTFFRVTIYDSPEKVISDVSAYTKRCRIIIDWPITIKEITASDNINSIKEAGTYYTAGIATNLPVSHDRTSALHGVLHVYQIPNTSNVYQSFIDYRQNYFLRRYDSSGGWGNWVQYAKYSDLSGIISDIETAEAKILSLQTITPYPAKIFKRVGCIGDSYTEGYINAGGSVVHVNDYAWPHYMETLTGNVWTNFGVGGSSSKSWVLNNDNYSKLSDVQAEGNKCQAYVIGLMINDQSQTHPTKVTLGTIEDIGTDADSYYAYYYKLIILVHAVNTNAPIFCNTCPKDGTSYIGYNQAVRDIVTYCQNNNLPVYLCDLASNNYNTPQFYQHPIYTSDLINGHYSGIGYEMMAECYLRVLSDVILSNIANFQTVHLIPYDEPT